MKVHFIGIGGIGVSALAQYYLAGGHKVSGSDLNSSEITKALQKKGAKIFIGKHKVKNVPKDIDLVIYSPAVTKDNPELKRSKVKSPQRSRFATLRGRQKSKVKLLSYPEALGELTRQYFTIAVSGTHGKSTTTAMIALILIKAGLDPTVVLGTKLKEFGNSNFRMGKKLFRIVPRLVPPGSAILVIEADEHFASFLNYWPKIIVLTNVEKDHLDYYKNLKNIFRAFKEYIGHLSEDGILVVNRDDANITGKIIKMSKTANKKIKPPNYKSVNTTFLTAVKNVVYFSLRQREAKKIKKILRVPGEHNVSNALAALTVARALKIPDKVSYKTLSEYKGSWRRFELFRAELRGTKRGTTRKITIVSDYGHHPTEVRATVKAAREKWPKKIIWLVFQPHQYQRTFYLFKNFVQIFREALVEKWIDKLIMTDIYNVAGREKKEIRKKVNSEKLVKRIKCATSGFAQDVVYIPGSKNFKEITDYLKRNLRSGEVIIIMGAGDIYKLINIVCQKGAGETGCFLV